MANKSKTPIVEIELDRKRHLRFDWNWVAELQDLGYGEKAIKGLKGLRDMIWAGLIWEDPNLT